MEPSRARAHRNTRTVQILMVSCAASPGATSLRPPENPSIRCGSMKLEVIEGRRATNRSSIQTGVPERVTLQVAVPLRAGERLD